MCRTIFHTNWLILSILFICISASAQIEDRTLRYGELVGPESQYEPKL